MMKLQDLGKCHNINFVTPEHVVPQVALAILEAREKGLRVPIVYNTGGYDALEAIELLDGLVDIYLVDFKVPINNNLIAGVGGRHSSEVTKSEGLSYSRTGRDQSDA